MAKLKAKKKLSVKTFLPAKAKASAGVLAKREKNKALGAKKKVKNNLFKDSDADGLSDADEINLGTDPKNCDSDNDGVNDYEEVNIYGTDPLNLDTDGDGVKDGDEIKRNRNPKGPGLLKDLFIPNIHNNFKPLSLQPKRIIFYSLSAVLFKVILVITVIVLPIEAWLTPDILVEQSKKIINLTNAVRIGLNLAPLVESQLLNQAAYEKAEDMLLRQYFSHNGPDGKTLAGWLKQIKYDFSVAGENLAMGFTSPEEVVNGWTRSQTHYKNMVDRDFKEIGVGMVSGSYDKVETTLVAQYFGVALSQPAMSLAVPAVKAETIAKTTPPAASTGQSLGEKVKEIQEPAGSKKIAPAVKSAHEANQPPVDPLSLVAGVLIFPQASADEAPLIDTAKSKLYVDQPQGQTEKIVRAEVYLSPAAAKAQVNFNNYFIELKPVAGEASKWIGQTIIFGDGREQIFNPVVLASVMVEDGAGNKTAADLEWGNIKPVSTSLLKQYYFVKQHQTPYIQPLFNITSIYYKIILLIAFIALALNILIEIKKQHPRVILSAMSLIALLILLIIL